jgi:uncharacterized protein (DUF697 family)
MSPKALAEMQAREIVNKWTIVAGTFSWVPGSTLVLGAADIKMVNDVAVAFGVQGVAAESVFAAVGASMTGKGLVEALSFFPGPGWIAKGLIASGITKATGEAVISYFRARSPLEGESGSAGGPPPPPSPSSPAAEPEAANPAAPA